MAVGGDLKDRYTFQRRVAGAVVNGLDQVGGWGAAAPDAYACSAQTTWLHGSETVQAARLQGDQPVLLTIRACAAARLIDTSWRALDARIAGRVFNITAVTLTPDRAWVEILAVWKKGDVDG